MDEVLVFTKRAENVKTVSCSEDITWYIDNNNNLYGCGSSSSGQQGSDDIAAVLTFTKRASNVKGFSCSAMTTWYIDNNDNLYGTTWYIDNNDNLYGCGLNSYGNQGSGNTSGVYTFTKRDYKTE